MIVGCLLMTLLGSFSIAAAATFSKNPEVNYVFGGVCLVLAIVCALGADAEIRNKT